MKTILLLLSFLLQDYLRAQVYSCEDSLRDSGEYYIEFSISWGPDKLNSLRILPIGIISFYHVLGKKGYSQKVYRPDNPYNYCKLIEYCKEIDIFSYMANEHQINRNQTGHISYYDSTGCRISTEFLFPYNIMIYNPYTLQSISFNYIMCDPKINELIEFINNCIPKKHYERLRLNKNKPHCIDRDNYFW